MTQGPCMEQWKNVHILKFAWTSGLHDLQRHYLIKTWRTKHACLCWLNHIHKNRHCFGSMHLQVNAKFAFTGPLRSAGLPQRLSIDMVASNCSQASSHVEDAVEPGYVPLRVNGRVAVGMFAVCQSLSLLWSSHFHGSDDSWSCSPLCFLLP